jgi:hypothetical protein
VIRIGVVCEGQSDYHAVESFFGSSLKSVGVEGQFEALQPEMDRTQPEAGWGNVLLWLKNNPPATRIQRYFGGGLFGGGLGTQPLDCLIVQLDSDILGEPGFSKFVFDAYGFSPDSPHTPSERAAVIRRVIEAACAFNEMVDLDQARHIPAPAVESTEAWCIAAFAVPTTNCEVLTGQQLVDQFMTAIELSESRPATPPYTAIDKSPRRRKKFCTKHKGGSERILNGCAQFRGTHDRLVGVANTQLS